MLIEVLNETKDADLLSYEQFLANNSHMIVIVCESAGSLVELGAFTNNEYTVDKVIASVDKKRTKDKSFIDDDYELGRKAGEEALKKWKM